MDFERQQLLQDFSTTADILVKNGLNFPKFEVNYEQSIIAPAASTANRPTMPMPTPTTRTGH